MKNILQYLHKCVLRRKSKILAAAAEDVVMIVKENLSETNKDLTAEDGDNNARKPTLDEMNSPPTSSQSLDCIESPTCATKEYDIVKTYIDIINKHENKMLKKVLSPVAIYDFNGLEVLGSVIVEVHEQLVKSFPDFHFSYDRIEVTSPGVVLISNLIASGTHTGMPFTFGPYEEIDAADVRVVLDPDDVVVTIDMERELMTHLSILPKGQYSGPQGFYEKIGGIVI